MRWSRPMFLTSASVFSRVLKTWSEISTREGGQVKIEQPWTEVEAVRGRHDPQVTMLAFIDLETRVPPDHPLRIIKKPADQALKALSPDLERMYATVGRPSIPPERLVKSSLLIALYSVRSERAFCEQLDYNLLFRWFLGMNPVEPSTTVALLMLAGITAVGSGIFGLWPGASVSIATSQAQNQRNSLASIPGG